MSADIPLPGNGGVAGTVYSHARAAFGVQLTAPFTGRAAVGLSPPPTLWGLASPATRAGRSRSAYSVTA